MVNRRQPREKVTAEVPHCAKVCTRWFMARETDVEGNICENLHLFATSHYFRTQAGLTEPR